MQVGVLHEAQQSCEILARTHGAALHANVLEEQSRELRTGWSPVVAPQMAMVPPGRTDRTEWPHVAAPTDSITASTLRGNRAPGLQRGVRAKFQRFGALVRVARGDEHLQTGGMGELDGRSGHAAARALNEHGVARA